MRLLKAFRVFLRAVLAATVVVACGVLLMNAVRPTTSDLGSGQPDTFTIGTAILVVGYLLFPVVALLAAALLLVALMLLVASAIERRRAGPRHAPVLPRDGPALDSA